MEITELLYHTQKNDASDLHLRPGVPPFMRINGDVLQLKVDSLTKEQVKEMLYSIMTDAQRTIFERELELDFAIHFADNLRFRVNAFDTMHGMAASFRIIPMEIRTLDDLGMPDTLRKLASLPKGLVLVTGPTGCGKSTTLAAMVDYINQYSAKHIITVEDPIEFIHTPKRSLINQRELGTNTLSFSKALKSSLRQDPDVIMVGEMRDLETIELALTASETGHLVFATLHTNSAAKSIDRIIDAFPPADKEMVRSMLSTSLEGVVSQLLFKRKDSQGRVAALEILLGTTAVRNLIRENKISQIQSLIQVGGKQGMRTMKDSVYSLMEKGIIAQDEAYMTFIGKERSDADKDMDNLKKDQHRYVALNDDHIAKDDLSDF